MRKMRNIPRLLLILVSEGAHHPCISKSTYTIASAQKMPNVFVEGKRLMRDAKYARKKETHAGERSTVPWARIDRPDTPSLTCLCPHSPPGIEICPPLGSSPASRYCQRRNSSPVDQGKPRMRTKTNKAKHTQQTTAFLFLIHHITFVHTTVQQPTTRQIGPLIKTNNYAGFSFACMIVIR